MSVVRTGVFATTGAFLSLAMVIAANIFYKKIGTYHEVDWFFGEENEPGYLKLLRLSLFNFIIAITVTGLLFIYTAFPASQSDWIGLTEGKALIAAAIIMNFAIRVCSLSQITDNLLYERSISFGFSFVLSIYFLSLFGVSSYLLSNGFSLSAIEIPPVSGSELTIILSLVIIGPVVSALLSEGLLILTGVKPNKKDEFSEEDVSLL
jgi:hypothetical protein